MPGLRSVRLSNSTGRQVDGPTLKWPPGAAYAPEPALQPPSVPDGGTAEAELPGAVPTRAVTLSASVESRSHEFLMDARTFVLKHATFRLYWDAEGRRYRAKTEPVAYDPATGQDLVLPADDVGCTLHEHC